MLRRAISVAALVSATLLSACTAEQRDIVTGQLKPYHFPTSSMEPTIKTGEYVLAQPLESGADIQRGELVVFKYPIDPKTVFGKRVVGLPGDTIEIHHKQLSVNGRDVSEPYVVHSDETEYNQQGLPEPYKSRDNFGPIVVPANEYFVLGDNRDRSSDSRYWGNVPRGNILGKIVRAGTGVGGPFRQIE